MQTSNASTSRPVIPLNISAAFAQFAHLPSVADGRNLHRMPPDGGTTEIMGNGRPAAAASKLLEVLKGITYSLNAAMAQPILDQRVITLYKENSEHEHAIQKAALTAQLTLQALSAAHQPASMSNHFQPSAFGLELPLMRSRASTFILSSLESWAVDAGLEFFLDDQHTATEVIVPFPSTAGFTTATVPDAFVKKKKIIASITKDQLLVDIEFECHPLAEDKRIDLVQNDLLVPISLREIRVHNGQKDDAIVPAEFSRGGTLQALLEETVREFLKELGCGSGPAWRGLDFRRAERAAARLKVILRELNWIADTVKQETEQSAERGLEWSECISTMGEKAMVVLRKETEVLQAQQEPSNPVVPADILALRTSGIPIPYLISFSLSFLLHLPPLAYLTALQRFNPAGTHHGQVTTDIPLESIRQLLSNHERRERLEVLVASIAYEPDLPVREVSFGMDETASLDGDSSKQEVMGYTFLKKVETDSTTGGWVLSFSLGETGRPLIISQSRMKRIATTIHLPTSPKDDNFDIMRLAGNADTIGPSWLDLAMDPQCTHASRVYTSRYQPNSSTNGDDPDLVNTLMALTEPGLALGKVPVRMLKEAYAVMQIVKEQVWLQSLLSGAGFRPGHGAADVSGGSADDAGQMMGGLSLGGESQSMDAEEAKALYDALMNGTYVAKRLRVTYEVLGDGRTGLCMRFPLGESVVVTEITLDVMLPRGVKVVVDGKRVEAFEEVVRRGGLFGLVISVRRFALERA